MEDKNKIIMINNWMEMVGYLTMGNDIAVKDTIDGECFWIESDWAAWIMHYGVFQEGYLFYTQILQGGGEHL